SEGVREAAETVSHSDLGAFFKKYVAGTDEIPWNDFFKTVGLQLTAEKVEAADLGFTAARNFGFPLTVTSVAEGSAAGHAGLVKGDVIVKINGHDPSGNFAAALRSGETIQLRIRNQNGEQEFSWQLAARDMLEFRLENMENLTSQQKARRAAWLKGDSEPLGQAHP
ncbi:MAG: PDZ domain-containing protein, partial [Terriglobales bacterium]